MMIQIFPKRTFNRCPFIVVMVLLLAASSSHSAPTPLPFSLSSSSPSSPQTITTSLDASITSGESPLPISSTQSNLAAAAAIQSSLSYDSESESITSTTEMPSRKPAMEGNNEKSPATASTTTTTTAAASSGKLDTITVEASGNNEMLNARLVMTSTTNENLIGSVTEAEATPLPLRIKTTINIHETESSPSVPNDLSAIAASIAIETNENNKNKSINLGASTGSEAEVDVRPETDEIKMPIKHAADNFKVMDVERDTPKAASDGMEMKKGKLKAEKSFGKKKAMKMQATDKKQKQKSKLYHDMNNAMPANEATTTSFSTSIKTAPTTIKSTTLTTISSFVTTPSYRSTSELTATSSAYSAALPTTEQHDSNNVIVLNSNASGLIVVDILENFGKTNVTAETFEIKMDLIDEVPSTAESRKSIDDIFQATLAAEHDMESPKAPVAATTANDDIILINENSETATESIKRIKWNEVKNEGNIKITFDNIDLSSQNVNVSIENGELVIDSIDISLLNKAEDELRSKKNDTTFKSSSSNNSNKTDSLEIILIEDDSSNAAKEINKDNLNGATTSAVEAAVAALNDDSNERERRINDDDEELHATTIHFEVPNNSAKHERRLKKIEDGDDEEDGIKIKTTDKDSDTIFYISNTEVKVIESIPTSLPNASIRQQSFYPAIYEEDVIVDVPNKNQSTMRYSAPASERYEEDIVLSPLTSDFDSKDVNYIGEAFLDVEESQSGNSENRRIIPLTSDVVIQPVKLQDTPNIGIPIIGELPPQIELEEMVFSDDYDSGKQSNFRVEEYYPNFLSNRLVKSQPLEAEVPRELIANGTLINSINSSNKTHINSINTIITNSNMTANLTTIATPLTNGSAFALENDDNENADLNDIQTLFLACFATLTPLILCVVIALTFRYCWRKYHAQNSSGGDLISDKSTDPLAEKSHHDEMKSTESGLTLDKGNGSTELLLAPNGDATPTNNHSSGTNGSIITMTLKNNHLIVETEERNDISRDTRETKMHYSPSEKDGVFIVESARGADQNGSHKPSPLQQAAKAPLEIPEEIKIDTLQSHFTPSSPEEEHRKQPKPEQVEVHTPPADLKVNGKMCNGTKTGLSQSDLSLTSSSSSNQNYSYGDRDTYQFDEKGYKGSSPKRIINVHCHDLKPLIENSPPTAVAAVAMPATEDSNNKPVITSAIFKDHTPEDGEPERLKSDMQATMNGPTKVNGIINVQPPAPLPKTNGLDEITSAENFNGDCNGETMDSLSYLPAPPEEFITQIGNGDGNNMELASMDLMPPPPPADELREPASCAAQS